MDMYQYIIWGEKVSMKYTEAYAFMYFDNMKAQKHDVFMYMCLLPTPPPPMHDVIMVHVNW